MDIEELKDAVGRIDGKISATQEVLTALHDSVDSLRNMVQGTSASSILQIFIW